MGSDRRRRSHRASGVPDRGRASELVPNPLRFLTKDDFRLLHECAERRRYAPDEVILEEASRQRAIFVIRSGTVRVERDHLGRGVPFAILDDGEMFGEMSFLEENG